MAILRSEVTAIYEALRAGRQPTELPPLPIQYADFAAWQRARLDGGALEAQARPQQYSILVLICQAMCIGLQRRCHGVHLNTIPRCPSSCSFRQSLPPSHHAHPST